MEIETKIAKENVEEVIKYERMDDPDNERAKTHKQTCQRWLEFLEGFKEIYKSQVEKKIKDLKQANKIYNENGI